MSAEKREENLSLGADFGKLYGSDDYEKYLKLQDEEEYYYEEEKYTSITEPKEAQDLGGIEDIDNRETKE